MKGLILCAGRGTRLRPFSYSQPKTLLPVINKPVILFCIEKMIDIGIRDIGIVIHPTHEKRYHEKIDTQKLGVSITYVYQHEPKGISHAIMQAETFLVGEPFVLLLGDNLIEESLWNLKEAIEKQRVNGALLLSKVENPSDYGIVEVKGGSIVSIEEKPQYPKSNLAATGAYAFDQTIFKAISSIVPSARGEYEITDAIQWMLDQGYTISYSETKKPYSDVGTVKRWLEANRWMLKERTNMTNVISDKSHIENCTLIPPVIIGDGCYLKDSTIGPNVSIAQGVIIESCTMENSIVLEKSELQHISTPIKNSVLGRCSQVYGGVQETELSEYVLGDYSSVIINEYQKQSKKKEDK